MIGTATWLWRFAVFKLGIVPTCVQFVPVKLAFSCNSRLVEGIVQEITAFPLEAVMLNDGIGGVWRT